MINGSGLYLEVSSLAELRRSERVVLVTGAAGFIGFHIAKELVQGWGVRRVVGVDLFNDYYDVQLKKDRASYLRERGVEVIIWPSVCTALVYTCVAGRCTEEMCVTQSCCSTCSPNTTSLMWFTWQLRPVSATRWKILRPTSLPTTSASSLSLTPFRNFQYANCLQAMCFIAPALQAYLVYASSSSVYGKRATVPFSSEEPLKAPGNLYAASKIMNEHLASAYCSQHGVHSIGLRFFTVYGPWGRPDMAAYKFAERIVTGMPVPLFEAGPGQQLRRDFTYIDDIVSGVLSALERIPERCGEAYNLGYGEPLIVEDMLHYLEEELATTAVIVSFLHLYRSLMSLPCLLQDRQPLPPSDMILTFADITTSQRVLGFSPKTSTAEGVLLNSRLH